MKIKLYKTDFLINGGIALALGAFFYYKSKSYWIGGLSALVMFFYLMIHELLESYLKTKRQLKILDSKAFMYLRLNGFKKYQKEGVPGLVGEYRGFWMQVYYTYEELFKGKYVRMVVLVAHYKFDTSIPEKEQLRSLEKLFNAHKTNLLKTYTLEWFTDVVVYKLSVGVINPSEKKLIKHLNRFADILKQEGFEARTEEEVLRSLNL